MVRKRKRDVFQLPYGDVTEEDRRTYAKTMFLYRQFRERQATLSKEARARALMSFVHDYITIGMDEAADMLMLEIDRICPNYFNGPLLKDMEEPRFEKICLKIADFYGNLFNKMMKGKKR